MVRFAVDVRTDRVDVVRDAVLREGMGVAGSSHTSFGGSPEPQRIGNRLVVVLDASSEDDAVRRVRQVVGDGPEVGPALHVATQMA